MGSSDVTALPRRTRGIYYGWWIVAAWVVLNVYWAGTLFYGLTVFFTPVRQTFGWSAALTASIFSLPNLLSGLLAPVGGAWFDRSGPRPLMLVACLCGAAGLLALGRTTSLPSFIAAFAVISVGYGIWSGTGIATAGLWFNRRRGLATGIVVAGSALGGLLVPLWQTAINQLGWRTTVTLAGLGMLAIGISASLVLRHRPAALGLLPDGGRTEQQPHNPELPVARTQAVTGRMESDGDLGFWSALRTWQFWTVSAITSAVLAGSSATTVLLLPRLRDAEVSADVAVAVATSAILLGAIGRPLCGFLADHGPIPRLAAGVFALQAAGLFVFALAPNHLASLFAFVLAFGLTNDAVRMLASLIVFRYFGARALGRILGMLQLLMIPGRVLGPVIAGAFHDGGYGYGSGFVLLAAITLATILPTLMLRSPASTAGARSRPSVSFEQG